MGDSRRQWGAKGRRRDEVKSGDRRLRVCREWQARALPERKREHVVSDYAQHTIPRSGPTHIQGAPWPLPPHACRLLDSMQMDSEAKLQSQVKSNSRLGDRGPGAQLPHLPGRGARRLCTPHGHPTHMQHLGLPLGEAHSCPRETLARLALALAARSPPLLEGEQSLSTSWPSSGEQGPAHAGSLGHTH